MNKFHISELLTFNNCRTEVNNRDGNRVSVYTQAHDTYINGIVEEKRDKKFLPP
jgi:hypothetical protein